VIWSLGRLRHTPSPVFVQTWLTAARPCLSSAKPQELPNMLWGLGRVGAVVPTEWSDAALARALELRPSLKGQVCFGGFGGVRVRVCVCVLLFDIIALLEWICVSLCVFVCMCQCIMHMHNVTVPPNAMLNITQCTSII